MKLARFARTLDQKQLDVILADTTPQEREAMLSVLGPYLRFTPAPVEPREAISAAQPQQ